MKLKPIKNKKAMAFGIGLVLVTVLAISLSLYIFIMVQKNSAQNTKTAQEILSFEQEKSKIKYYSEESEKLAASEALDFLTQTANGVLTPKGASCGDYGGRIIWSDNCNPNNLNDIFSEQFKTEFDKLIKKYPTEIKNYNVVLQGNKISIENATFDFIDTRKEGYNITFKFDKVSEIDMQDYGLDLEELKNLYINIKEAKISCTANSNSDLATCVQNKISLQNWKITVTEQAGYLLFDLETNKHFFATTAHQLEFKTLKISFAV
jgi:hypothetical protein